MNVSVTRQIKIRKVFSFSTITGPLVTFLVVFLLFALFVPNFLSLRSISGIINAATLTGMVTIGITLLMIAGEFDLSVGALVAMGGYIFGTYANQGSPLMGVFLTLLLSALLGLINGLIVISTRIPSFIVTLGTRSIFRGAVWLISGGALLQTIEKLPIYDLFNGRFDLLNDLIRGANFRTAALWVLLVALICQYLLTRTRFGNHIFASGGNPQAAVAQGVNVRRTKVLTFVISSVLGGFTGILLYSQFTTVRVATGAGMELSAIAAAVVGGTLLEGGSGSIWGALIGVLLINTLRTGVVLLDIPFIPADNFEAIVGVTIVSAVVLNNWLRKR